MRVLQIKINSLWNVFSEKPGVPMTFRNRSLANGSDAAARGEKVLEGWGNDSIGKVFAVQS